MHTIPKGWALTHQGGGATDLYRCVPNSVLEWGITQIGAPTAPESPDDPCTLTLWSRGDAILQWDCSCLAEAIQIAEGARL